MRHNLSDSFELIKDRRTIYPELYSERKIHKEIVDKLLNAAIWAPTHGNTQPWRFTVFAETGLNKLSTFLGEAYKKHTPEADFSDMKLDKLMSRPLMASTVIAICMKREEAERIPEIEEVEAVACSVQNIHLMATAYGIGGFWSTPKFIYNSAVNSFFGLDQRDKVLGLFYLGYPKTEWPKGQRRPIEYISNWITE